MSIACRSVYHGEKVDLPSGTNVTLSGTAQETGDKATQRYHVTSGSKQADGTMTSIREGGVWCFQKAKADSK
ncbi:hypothetical protein [Amycolatopsis jejuensis]|uniref:hypothetical protein n=1 Tax=Amycolatopsis jejuensis TaxID=330084 RepID=UPI000689C379|nr:hypothetical protein [Amycolatopsis jejuensis]